MNSKGLFCFVLLLGAIAIETGLLNQGLEAKRDVAGGKAIAFEAEKTAFVRTVIENSVDAVIEWELYNGLLLNLGPEEIKQRVNRKLLVLFGEIEKAYGKEIKVRFYAGNGVLSEGFLNENSKVLVTRINRGTIAAEYNFTAGLLKNNLVFAEIAGKKTKQFFKIPAGYSLGKTVIG